MKTLKEAWDWYEHARTNLYRMQRLGTHHWDERSSGTTKIQETTDLWKDEKFKRLSSRTIQKETARALQPLDDLGILVLFSVFESAVRMFLETRVKDQASHLTDPILKHAAEEAIEGLQEGSFGLRVLKPLQDHIGNELIEKVSQVRQYRNWVAHGKRESMREKLPAQGLEPQDAYDRLKEFLELLGIAVEPELEEPEPEEPPQLHEAPP
jgi:hypothetical protein